MEIVLIILAVLVLILIFANIRIVPQATEFVIEFLGKYRTTWGYQGGIEYYPMKENLHFFAAYRGKRYTYTALGKNFQALDEHPQTFSLGLIYKIPIL